MNVFQAAADAIRTGRPCAMVTITSRLGSTPRSAGARMLVYADGTTVGTVGGGAFEYEAIATAVTAIADGAVTRYEAHLVHELGMCCGGRMEALIEPLDVTWHAVVYGAGHVSHATVPLLRSTGFRVTVVDARPDWLNAERFPDCERRVVDPREVVAELTDAPVHLVLTHDHGLDQDVVEVLLPSPAPWVGLIGSKAKRARFRTRLLAAAMPPETFDRLHCPVGLDIGAQTPEEIGVAIVADLVGVRRQGNVR